MDHPHVLMPLISVHEPLGAYSPTTAGGVVQHAEEYLTAISIVAVCQKRFLFFIDQEALREMFKRAAIKYVH